MMSSCMTNVEFSLEPYVLFRLEKPPHICCLLLHWVCQALLTLMRGSLFPIMPFWNEHRNIIVKIFLQVLLSLTILGLKQKEWRMTTQGMSNQSPCNIESHPSKLDFALQNSSVGDELLWKILCHVANSSWLSLPLNHAQLAKQQSCSFISIWINLYNTFMVPLFTIVCIGFDVFSYTF